jgi:hypothetical protein
MGKEGAVCKYSIECLASNGNTDEEVDLDDSLPGFGRMDAVEK